MISAFHFSETRVFDLFSLLWFMPCWDGWTVTKASKYWAFYGCFWNKKRSSKKKSMWSLYLNDGETPRQKNTYNCGVFICLLCYLISKQQPVKFDQSIIPSFRSHMAISIVECKTYEINHLRCPDTLTTWDSWIVGKLQYQTIQIQLLSTTRHWAFFNCEVSYCKVLPWSQ